MTTKLNQNKKINWILVENLNFLMTNGGLAKKDLAEIANVSEQSAGYWLRGEKIPTNKALKNIGDYFKIEPATLINKSLATNKKEITVADIAALQSHIDVIEKELAKLKKEVYKNTSKKDVKDYLKELLDEVSLSEVGKQVQNDL